MVNALTVANTILEKGLQDNIDISPMKIQKLTFCLYKEYLKQTGTPLFNERFETWKYGPVLRSVYEAFKSYGSNAIKDYATASDGNIYVVNTSGAPTFRAVLDKVWDMYSRYDGITLSILTHRAGTAWRKAFDAKRLYLSDNEIAEEADYEPANT